MKKGIAGAMKTLKNIRDERIENQEVLLNKKVKISDHRVQMKLNTGGLVIIGTIAALVAIASCLLYPEKPRSPVFPITDHLIKLR
jgi:hypothetical protein